MKIPLRPLGIYKFNLSILVAIRPLYFRPLRDKTATLRSPTFSAETGITRGNALLAFGFMRRDSTRSSVRKSMGTDLLERAAQATPTKEVRLRVDAMASPKGPLLRRRKSCRPPNSARAQSPLWLSLKLHRGLRPRRSRRKARRAGRRLSW